MSLIFLELACIAVSIRPPILPLALIVILKVFPFVHMAEVVTRYYIVSAFAMLETSLEGPFIVLKLVRIVKSTVSMILSSLVKLSTV